MDNSLVAKGLRCHVRWMIRRDMVEVMQADSGAYQLDWPEEEFLRCLRQRNCIGMVAEHGEKVLGFMIYELHKSKLEVLRMSVVKHARRQGVGGQMVAKLLSKLSSHRRTRIGMQISENDLDAHLFLRAVGFRAINVIRQGGDMGEDAYRFVYQYANGVDTHETEEVEVE